MLGVDRIFSFEELEEAFHVDTSVGSRSTPKSLLLLFSFFILLLAVSPVVIKNQISIDRTLTQSKVC